MQTRSKSLLCSWWKGCPSSNHIPPGTEQLGQTLLQGAQDRWWTEAAMWRNPGWRFGSTHSTGRQPNSGTGDGEGIGSPSSETPKIAWTRAEQPDPAVLALGRGGTRDHRGAHKPQLSWALAIQLRAQCRLRSSSAGAISLHQITCRSTHALLHPHLTRHQPITGPLLPAALASILPGAEMQTLPSPKCSFPVHQDSQCRGVFWLFPFSKSGKHFRLELQLRLQVASACPGGWMLGGKPCLCGTCLYLQEVQVVECFIGVQETKATGHASCISFSYTFLQSRHTQPEPLEDHLHQWHFLLMFHICLGSFHVCHVQWTG